MEEATRRLLFRITEETHASILNKLLGIFPGILHGFLWLSLLSILLLLIPIGTGTAEEVRKSTLNDWVIAKVNWMQDQLSPVFGELVSTVIQQPAAALGHKEYVKLNFQVNHAKIRGDLEAEMLSLVNAERQKHGLRPLKADPETTQTARKHSADMLSKGYFSHNSPDGRCCPID
ncbi:CAP domain-containing protein [Pedobacter sp. GR22-6]|uniref:CAP domain-containing protein n=1 Tax=Pedobacter sp. GR22-6 TaxID=3127957 RepID=UPI00307F33DF